MNSAPDKIKVLHLITSLEMGGTQNGLLLGLPRFDTGRYQHVLCSIMDQMQMAPQFRDAGIEVTSLELNSKFDVLVALRLRNFIKKYKPDILHTYLLHSNLLGRVVGKLAGVPLIIGSERTVGLTTGVRKIASKLTNPLTDRVEVNATYVGEATVRDLGVPESKIEVVRSGFDFSLYESADASNSTREQLGVKPEEFMVFSAARFRPSKGVEYVLRTFARALTQEPNLKLVLAGEGEQDSYLQDLASELGVADRCNFLGRRADVPKLLMAADAMLLMSLNEGLPRIALEAMAAETPVIATNVGATHEIVVNEETGLLVEPKDVETAAQGLVRLAQDKELGESIASNARRNVVENYSIENYVSRLDTLYRHLLNSQGGTNS